MSNRVIFFSQETNPFLNIDDHLTNDGCSLGDLSNIDTALHLYQTMTHIKRKEINVYKHIQEKKNELR